MQQLASSGETRTPARTPIAGAGSCTAMPGMASSQTQARACRALSISSSQRLLIEIPPIRLLLGGTGQDNQELIATATVLFSAPLPLGQNRWWREPPKAGAALVDDQ